MSELANCPFCGGPAISSYCRDGCLIVCKACRAEGPEQYHGREGQPSAEDRAVAAWNRRAPPEPSAGWRGIEGTRQNDPAGFIALVQASPGFWTYDFAPKYLNITIDTREPAVFWLADRDNEPITPQRVIDAINAHAKARGHEPAKSASGPVGELEEHKALSPLVGQGNGSANASRAATGPLPRIAPEAEPSGDSVTSARTTAEGMRTLHRLAGMDPESDSQEGH